MRERCQPFTIHLFMSCNHWLRWRAINVNRTCVSRPIRKSVPKNTADHTLLSGSIASASGYTMKARPGPDVMTSATSMPEWCDMKPRTEKTTRPARKLVTPLMRGTTIEILRQHQHTITASVKLEQLLTE